MVRAPAALLAAAGKPVWPSSHLHTARLTSDRLPRRNARVEIASRMRAFAVFEFFAVVA